MATKAKPRPLPAPKASYTGVVRPQGGPHPGHAQACTTCDPITASEPWRRGVTAAHRDAGHPIDTTGAPA
jgi:hypothetical protein